MPGTSGEDRQETLQTAYRAWTLFFLLVMRTKSAAVAKCLRLTKVLLHMPRRVIKKSQFFSPIITVN